MGNIELVDIDDTEVPEYDLALDGRKVQMAPDYKEDTILSQPKAVRELDDAQYNEDSPGYLCCPISTELMEDPVILESGQTYDRKSISIWLATNDTDPLTRRRIVNKKMTPNYAIKSQIEEWKTKHKV